MKVGIIIYSQTGNTLKVAQKLREKLRAEGHEAELESVTVLGKAEPGSKDFRLEQIPSVVEYNALIFGAPVHAFSLARAMQEYLNQLPPLEGKKVAVFVTKQTRFAWMGGNRAISQMKTACTERGAEVLGTEIIVWPQIQNNLDHIEAVEKLNKLI